MGPEPVDRFFLRAAILTASNFEALKPKDSLFTVSKDLNLLKKHTKNQEASYKFRLGFALSNRPHLHRVYALASRLSCTPL